MKGFDRCHNKSLSESSPWYRILDVRGYMYLRRKGMHEYVHMYVTNQTDVDIHKDMGIAAGNYLA